MQNVRSCAHPLEICWQHYLFIGNAATLFTPILASQSSKFCRKQVVVFSIFSIFRIFRIFSIFRIFRIFSIFSHLEKGFDILRCALASSG